MILKLYSIYDKKAEIFHPPHFCHNPAHARRMLQSLFKEKNVFSEYPEDFCIYEIGSFNDSSGGVTGISKPTPLIEGIALKGKNNALAQHMESDKHTGPNLGGS